jgi:hypothetical protein
MQVTAVFGFMIKKWQIGDQIHDHSRGELRDHPEASPGGIRDQNCTPRGFSGRSGLGGAHPLLPASTGTLVGVALKAADT